MEKLQQLMRVEEELLEFRDFDNWMQNGVNQLPIDYRPKTSQHVAHILFGSFKNYFFMMRVSSLKLFEIGRGIVSALRDENASVFLSLARSFLEHTSSLSYQRDILRKAVTKLANTNTFERFETISKELDADICTLFYGSSDKSISNSFVHVNDMIRSMKKDFNDVNEIYSYLCDFVHPNYGSNRLVSEGSLGTGFLLPHFSSFAEEVSRAKNAIDRCSVFAMQCQTDISKFLMELKRYIDIASRPETRVSQICQPMKSFSGDGKSQKTAISFDKARSHMESMLALNDYLKNTNAVIFARDKQKFKDGYYYERLDTNRGFIWVRFLVEE